MEIEKKRRVIASAGLINVIVIKLRISGLQNHEAAIMIGDGVIKRVILWRNRMSNE